MKTMEERKLSNYKKKYFPQSERCSFPDLKNQLHSRKFSHQCYYHEISEERGIKRNSLLPGVGGDIT